MQYNGGKAYTIKRWGMGDFWLDYLASTPTKRFVDVCCGSGAVSTFVGKVRPDIALVCNDVHPAAIAVLRAVSQEGWEPPTSLSEEEYRAQQVQAAAGAITPMTGFAGFGCSFGGKYFGGYARQKGYSYARGVAKVLKRDAPHLARADYYTLDYAALPDAAGVLDGDVWYIDPPYAGTQGYQGTPEFDHARFWAWATQLSQRVPVLVSEFVAPDGWQAVWSVKRKLGLCAGKTAQERIDHVFAFSAARRDL